MPIPLFARMMLPKLIQLAKKQPDRFRAMIKQSPKLREIFQKGIAGTKQAGSAVKGKMNRQGLSEAGAAAKNFGAGARDFGAQYGGAVKGGYDKLSPFSKGALKFTGGGAALGGGFEVGSRMLGEDPPQQATLEELIMQQLITDLGLPEDTSPEMLEQMFQQQGRGGF